MNVQLKIQIVIAKLREHSENESVSLSFSRCFLMIEYDFFIPGFCEKKFFFIFFIT
jgi:hypothetical protein